MPLPSSNPTTKVSVMPGSLPINIAAYSPDPQKFTDAFDQGINQTHALEGDVLIRPSQQAADAATADNAASNARGAILIRPSELNAAKATYDNTTDQMKAAMLLRPMLQRVAAKQAEADFTKAKNEGTDASITEAALNHPDYQSGVVSAKIAVAEHAAREAQLQLDTLTKTGADITNEEVLKAQKRVRDAQYDLDTLHDEQKVLDIKRGTTTKAAQLGSTQADVALRVASNPGVQAAQADTATADVATARLASLTNLARQVAVGTISPTAITPEDDSKIRVAAQAKGVNVIDASGRPRPLADVSKEYAGKVAAEAAEPQLKEMRDRASSVAGGLDAIKTIKNLGDVSTGYLYTLPGVKQVDRTLAQLGVKESQNREVYTAMNTRLVPLVRQPGSVSDFEQKTYGLALPGPGVSERTNEVLVSGLYRVGERDTQKPSFYTNLLKDGVPAADIDQIWSQYMKTNPTILGADSLNKGYLTPDQYLSAVKNPEAAARSLAPSDPAVISSLPKGNSDAELAKAPINAPYVAVKNARGAEVPAANPAYWRAVLDASQLIQKPNTISPQSGAYVDAFRAAQATPLDTLLRVAPAAVPASPFVVPIRHK